MRVVYLFVCLTFLGAAGYDWWVNRRPVEGLHGLHYDRATVSYLDFQSGQYVRFKGSVPSSELKPLLAKSHTAQAAPHASSRASLCVLLKENKPLGNLTYLYIPRTGAGRVVNYHPPHPDPLRAQASRYSLIPQSTQAWRDYLSHHPKIGPQVQKYLKVGG